MIKRLILLIAVLIPIIGHFLGIDIYLTGRISIILICLLLCIVFLPWRFGYAPNPFAIFIVTISMIIIILIMLSFYEYFYIYPTDLCTVVTYKNGIIIGNETLPC